MVIRTTVFDLAESYGYRSDRALARAMGVNPNVIGMVRKGEMGVGPQFIKGAKRAFPDKTLDELFTVEDDREPEGALA